MQKYLLFIALLLTYQNSITAQVVDSTFSVIANELAQEKIYIHFDKGSYEAGETIWFKIYVFDGNLPSQQSKNLYADWYDNNGTLIKHDAFPVFQSSGFGQFLIPEKYEGKNLHVKAYTQWMLNFDTAFLFTKYIPIFSTNNFSEEIQVIEPIITFFPEGGSFVNGIESYVAFKATNQYGKPINVSGIIKNENGVVVDSLICVHDGMGLAHIPNPNSREELVAFFRDEYSTMEYSKKLPVPSETGVTLHTQKLDNYIEVTISRSDEISEENKQLIVYVIMNNKIYYNASVKMTTKKKQTFKFSLDSLPTGILQLTVLNDNLLPLAERIVFNKAPNFKFSPTVELKLKNFDKRGKNSIDIEVQDSLFSNLSLSITDAIVENDTSTNIFSELLLSGDIKGKIYNPSYYFNNNDNSTLQNLDLVMLTNGWRNYNWKEIANGNLPNLKYKKENFYTQINGLVFGIDKDDLVKEQNILFFLEAKDSSRSHLILPIKRDATFNINSLFFYDTIKVFYNFIGNKRFNRIAEISIQNGLFNFPSKFNLDTIISKYNKINYTYLAELKNRDNEYSRLVKTKGSGYLKEVIIKSTLKSGIDLLEERYVTGVFNGGDAFRFNLIDDTRAQAAFSIFNYLQGMVPGLQITYNGGQTNVSWRQQTINFFIDEFRSDVDIVNALNMTDIAYIKVFRPPFYLGFGGSPGGAIAIYTKKGIDVKSIPVKGLEYKLLEGYSAYKEFFSPNYEKEHDPEKIDFRTTLYWNPFIRTYGDQRKVTVEFFNNDVSKKLKLILCGFNSDGKLTLVEKIIE